MKFSLISRAAALAFLTAFVTLSTQILIHRMVSAKLLNNYAFLLIPPLDIYALKLNTKETKTCRAPLKILKGRS